MIFDNKVTDSSKITALLDGHLITASPHTKFLGITIDENLNWKEHISEVSKKVSKSNGVINRLKEFLPRDVLFTLYNALVLPHFNYSLLVWGNTHTYLLNNLFKLQKRVIRNTSHVNYRSNTVPLFIHLKTLTMYDLYKYQLGILCINFTGVCSSIYSIILTILILV